MPFCRALEKLKHKPLHLGFELGSLNSFPTTITITYMYLCASDTKQSNGATLVKL